MSNVTDLLSRLNKTLKREKTAKGNSSFADLKKLRDDDFIKLKEGINKFVFLTPAGSADPFTEWAYHGGLQEVSWYTVPCSTNFGEECTICKVVEQLQKENYTGNKHLWNPIKQQFEYYAPVINVESEATMAAGPKYLRLSKAPMTTIFDWLKNLEANELPFYSDEEPQRIIINYTKDAIPADKYKLDKKNARPFSEDQIAEWKSLIKPISTYFTIRNTDNLTKLVDEYLLRMEELVSSSEQEEQVEEKKVVVTESDSKSKTSEEAAVSEKKASSRLSSLKK